MGPILERAETDPELESLIDGIHKQRIAEDGIVVSQEEIERTQTMIRHIFRQYFEEC
jgi:hypothetical protein